MSSNGLDAGSHEIAVIIGTGVGVAVGSGVLDEVNLTVDVGHSWGGVGATIELQPTRTKKSVSDGI